MLILRYKALKDSPGYPAGTIFEREQGSHIYRAGESWLDQSVIEDAAGEYALHEVIESTAGVETAKFSADADVAVKAQADLATQIAAMQEKMLAVSVQLADAKPVKP